MGIRKIRQRKVVYIVQGKVFTPLSPAVASRWPEREVSPSRTLSSACMYMSVHTGRRSSFGINGISVSYFAAYLLIFYRAFCKYFNITSFLIIFHNMDVSVYLIILLLNDMRLFTVCHHDKQRFSAHTLSCICGHRCKNFPRTLTRSGIPKPKGMHM